MEGVLRADRNLPVLRKHLGPVIAFWIYAAICLFGFLWFRSRPLETQGMTLEQIEQELMD